MQVRRPRPADFFFYISNSKRYPKLPLPTAEAAPPVEI